MNRYETKLFIPETHRKTYNFFIDFGTSRKKLPFPDCLMTISLLLRSSSSSLDQPANSNCSILFNRLLLRFRIRIAPFPLSIVISRVSRQFFSELKNP